jgi:adenylate cyclase
MQGSPDAECLSDGITESVMDSLSELPNLKVMSHSAVFRYKGKEADPRAVGRELGVRAVLMARTRDLPGGGATTEGAIVYPPGYFSRSKNRV